ncbi:putative Mrr-cat superfamily restriction endonuclease [Peribacillus deserti]|uniref:Mrr-cat superfamily restriction endonuclease n=1 Tax=Peribacillus deserti TaxID=673318 RepID=A0ABS2QFT5_9BACI|nr:hypothetical protein [Peribacillus deserti]MBM7692015.1 putative Mrr-cat superfamily restriction endonuclease [Peribacillus deserti]
MNTQAWLIRPKPHDRERMNEFLEEEIVAVGWPHIGDLTGLREHHLRELIQSAYKESNSALATLKMIVYRMKPGDYVLVPYKGTIYFGKITSDYKYAEEKDNDEWGYPHQRMVRWYNLVLERDELPENLKKSTRVVRTAADLTSHVHTIEELLNEETILPEMSFHAEEPMMYMSAPAQYREEHDEHEEDEMEFIQRAKKVLEMELDNPDPMVRLRAAEIVLNLKK